MLKKDCKTLLFWLILKSQTTVNGWPLQGLTEGLIWATLKNSTAYLKHKRLSDSDEIVK